MQASSTVISRHRFARVAGLSLMGVGAGAIGVGAVFGIVAISSWGSAKDSCGGTPEHCKTAGFTSAQHDLDSARSAATISTWSIGLGGAVAVTGLLVYLSARGGSPAAESAIAWRAAPLAGPQTLGVVLTRSLP